MLPVKESELAAHDDNDAWHIASLDDYFATLPQAKIEFHPLLPPLGDALFTFERDSRFASDDEDFTTALAELFAVALDD
jgi:hypothetical protein